MRWIVLVLLCGRLAGVSAAPLTTEEYLSLRRLRGTANLSGAEAARLFTLEQLVQENLQVRTRAALALPRVSPLWDVFAPDAPGRLAFREEVVRYFPLEHHYEPVRVVSDDRGVLEIIDARGPAARRPVRDTEVTSLYVAEPKTRDPETRLEVGDEVYFTQIVSYATLKEIHRPARIEGLNGRGRALLRTLDHPGALSMDLREVRMTAETAGRIATRPESCEDAVDSAPQARE